MSVYAIQGPDGLLEFPTYAEAKSALIALYPEVWEKEYRILKEGEPEAGYRTWSSAVEES